MSTGDEGSEVSISNVYCVVYKLLQNEWKVNGEGWSQLHLYRDQLDGTHRIVGWTVSSFEVVINCNIVPSCRYRIKSDDFHKFTDEDGYTYGFGFYKKEESIRDSKKFMDMVNQAIKNPIYNPLNNNDSTLPSPGSQSSQSQYNQVGGGGGGQLVTGPPPTSPNFRLNLNNLNTTINTYNNNNNNSAPSSPTHKKNPIGPASPSSNLSNYNNSSSNNNSNNNNTNNNSSSNNNSSNNNSSSSSNSIGPLTKQSSVLDIKKRFEQQSNSVKFNTPTNSSSSNNNSNIYNKEPSSSVVNNINSYNSISNSNNSNSTNALNSSSTSNNSGFRTLPTVQPVMVARSNSPSLTTKATPPQRAVPIPPSSNNAYQSNSPPQSNSLYNNNNNNNNYSPSTNLPSPLSSSPSSTPSLLNTNSSNPVPSSSPSRPVPIRPSVSSNPIPASMAPQFSPSPQPSNISASTSAPARAGSLSTIPSPVQHSSNNSTMDDIYLRGKVPMGKLKILPAKPAKNRSESVTNVSDPYTVIHTQHVKYDIETRQYSGLPAEWESQLNKQFGIIPTLLENVAVEGFGYGARIPTVLEQMKNELINHGGLFVEGIFRLAPDVSESDYVKQQLNERRFTGCSDVNICANLIKVWYRDLPTPILSNIKQSVISDTDSIPMAGTVVDSMEEPDRSYLLWLLDLCVIVSKEQASNKMTAKNLAIVFGPNLFKAETITYSKAANGEGIEALQFSQKVARFMEFSILWRASQFPQ